MAPRATIVLKGRTERERAINWIGRAPDGWRIEFKEPVRSLDQNALMWVKLDAISKQVDWYGEKLTPEEWKDVFSSSLKKARVVPGLEGKGFVVLGLRTSDMSKEEFGNLLDLIDAFAAERGVTLGE